MVPLLLDYALTLVFTMHIHVSCHSYLCQIIDFVSLNYISLSDFRINFIAEGCKTDEHFTKSLASTAEVSDSHLAGPGLVVWFHVSGTNPSRFEAFPIS